VQNNDVVLSWQAGSDAQTPAKGLTYNLRVGTNSGGSGVVPCQCDPVTGQRRVPEMGNAQHRLFATLTNLPFGNYYWSVQSVDGTFAGSPFAPEQRFSIGAPLITRLLPQPGGTYVLSATGLPGLHCTVEASVNLVQWTGITNLVVSPGGLLEFRDLTATNYPWRFYRLKAPW
jgi:hypothetical protein